MLIDKKPVPDTIHLQRAGDNKNWNFWGCRIVLSNLFRLLCYLIDNHKGAFYESVTDKERYIVTNFKGRIS